MTSITDFDASDAQGVLTGHEGNIICIKTAWHGDKLLSGGADKTVRLWDLSVSVGKPLTTLRGHQGWVTETQFWGSTPSFPPSPIGPFICGIPEPVHLRSLP